MAMPGMQYRHRWYFLTRTDFRKTTGKGVEDEEEQPKKKEDESAGDEIKKEKDTQKGASKSQTAVKSSK